MMDRLRKAAVLTRLIDELRARGSWCGETHIQKSTLILQELLQVPLGFDFILYKHGPFSFDLRDELTGLRADELLRLKPQSPYGPMIVPTERCRYIQGLCAKTLAKYEGAIAFVARKLGTLGVAELERLATAFYVSQRAQKKDSQEKRATQLSTLKPHIPPTKAFGAVEEIDRIIDEAKEYAV